MSLNIESDVETDEISLTELLDRGVQLPHEKIIFKVDSFNEYSEYIGGVGGIYTFTHESEGYLYVGISQDLRGRLTNHISGRGNKALSEDIDRLSDVLVCVYKEGDSSLREFYENYLILKFYPKHNKLKKSTITNGYQVKWEEDVQLKVLRLREEGLSYSEITKSSGVPSWDIARILRNGGVRIQKTSPKMNKEQRETISKTIVALYKDGKSQREIAERVSLSATWVHNRLDEYYKETGEAKILRLKSRDEEIIRLYISENLSQSQVARTVGTSKKTVNTTLQRYFTSIGTPNPKRSQMTKEQRDLRNEQIISIHVRDSALTHRQIGEILNVPTTTVTSIIKTWRKKK